MNIIHLTATRSNMLQAPEFPVKGTTVVSAWLNFRIPSFTIFSWEGQLGSGQAISASVVIQSLAEVTLCLAGRSGRTDASYYQYGPGSYLILFYLTKAVDTDTLVWW
jgi:hypothetical protein